MNINILRYSLFGIAGGQEVDRKLFLKKNILNYSFFCLEQINLRSISNRCRDRQRLLRQVEWFIILQFASQLVADIYFHVFDSSRYSIV